MTELAFLSKSTRLTNYSAILNEVFSQGLSSTATILYRLLEMCKPIHVVGESKRRESGKQKMSVLKEIFEGGRENGS